MSLRAVLLLGAVACATVPLAGAQSGNLMVPQSVEAGKAFSIQSAGTGKATLYIVGPSQVLKQDVQLGETISIAAGSLYNAGHYLAILTATTSTDTGSFYVVPASQPVTVSFLAKPSRLPVGLHNGISGAVYVFDAYHNLITVPLPVSFVLSNPSSPTQQRSVTLHDGTAATEMDSTAKEGKDTFTAHVGSVSSSRVIEQVPGDPCSLKMSAQPSGKLVALQTDPVRDCTGNAVPDGTIVTFTENYNGTQSTVDVPIKRGIAQVEMAAHPGATISVASGVVLGNEIHWDK